jgi:xanthine dehydrogenase YagR molybdenum-binding subunit
LIGDADKAIADAAVKIERTFTMPDRHHNQMEPHATLAVRDDDGTLTLYDSTQMVVGTRKLASLAGQPPPMACQRRDFHEP